MVKTEMGEGASVPALEDYMVLDETVGYWCLNRALHNNYRLLT